MRETQLTSVSSFSLFLYIEKITNWSETLTNSVFHLILKLTSTKYENFKASLN